MNSQSGSSHNWTPVLKDMKLENITRDAGRRVMNELMGEGYVEAKDAKRNSFSGVLDDYAEEVCYGRIWSREGIDRKTRSIVNIAVLTALNRSHSLGLHVQAAIANGCSVVELREILLQTAVYCGLPAAGEAFKVAEEVLRTRHLLEPLQPEPK